MDKQSEFLLFPTIFIPFLLQYFQYMQSQTAFLILHTGQVLTVDLCFRHARLVLNSIHLVKVVFILKIVFRWSV